MGEPKYPYVVFDRQREGTKTIETIMLYPGGETLSSSSWEHETPLSIEAMKEIGDNN